MTTKKIIDEFTDLPISRQRKYQLRRVKKGVCISCGRPLFLGGRFCEKHYNRNQQVARKREGNNAWRKGHRGRPPLTYIIKQSP